MKGRAYIAWLRSFSPEMLSYQRLLCRHEALLLADAVEIADEAARSLIENEAGQVDGWMACPVAFCEVACYLSYLDRRGLIERKEGEPHLVRFVKEAGE